MKPLFEDTPPEIERRLIEQYRRMTPAEKMRRVRELGRRAEAFALAALRYQHPTADLAERRFRAAARRLPPAAMREAFGWDPPARRFGERGMSKPMDANVVIREVVAVLERLNVPYAIGGSVASSAHGEFRFTQDVDFVVSMSEGQAAEFAAALQGDFYADAEMIAECLQTRTSFNVIHLPTSYKADFFPAASELSRMELARRQQLVLEEDEGAGELAAYVVSPEDILLQKLNWYVMGGGVSERQWHDVQGVLRVQADALDFAYLRQWAAELNLTDLLQRALEDAGMENALTGDAAT